MGKINNAVMPLWDYVILEMDLDYVSKIIRPDTADPKKVGTLELKVITIGPDCYNIKIGDRLIFNPGAVVTFAYEGKQYWLISERATGVVIAEKRVIKRNPADRMPA